ncbi:MAG: UvrD-helicase domain-containing protein [Firmicutes bacterium]|nr:UvrD-helicase domain-containing protein [Bacillota bacterium]
MSRSGDVPKPLVDARERSLAESDLSRNYWVEAGAGTGKTTLLIRRLLNIIVQGAARLEEVVAITFTEKAAAELKARLRDELEKRLTEAAEEEARRIRESLEAIEAAPITTIHSFAGQLLRERPVEAAVDPQFQIYEPGEMEELLEEIWEKWFSAELAAEGNVLKRALLLGVSPKRLRELAGILYHQRDLVAEGSTPSAPDLLPAFRELLQERLTELKSLLPSCRQEEDKGYRHLLEIIAAAEKFLQLGDPLEQERFLLMRFPAIAARGSQKNWQPPEHCRRQKEICGELRQLQEQACLSLRGQLTASLVHWLGGYLAAVERAKAEAGVLDFQDLLIKARDLLRDNREVRGYFQRRFRYILVDEFQDTDPLQADLLFLLAEKEPRAASWQEVELAEGKLFLVGDPKQSIYRFRRADIEIYQAAREKLLQKGQALAITQNFRTLPALIDWVNRTFSVLITPQGHYQPAYQPLSAYRSPYGRPAVVLLQPSQPLDEARADEIRAAEAAAVAEFIEGAVGKWTIPAPHGGSRELRYGDIALLFPAATGLFHYEEALRRRKIPYRLEGGRQFYLREEIVFLKNLLAAVSNPYDQLALAAVLRYWAGAIPDEMLFQYLESGGRLSYFADAGPDFPQLQRAFELLRRAHQRQQQAPISVLVEELLEETWFWQRASLGPQGRQAAGNLRKALQMIRGLEMERPLTLKGYISRLERMAEEEREEAESLLYDPGSDAVQLLTIHKSKGLEFPLVCLVNLGGQKRGGTSFMADRSRGLFYLKLGELASAGVAEAEQEEALRLEAERIRLFYVAATRARDYLVLPRFYKSGAAGFWAYLEQAEEAAAGLWSGCLSLQAGHEEPLPGDDAGALAGILAEGEESPLVEELLARRRHWEESLKKAIAGAATPGPYISAVALAGMAREPLPPAGEPLTAAGAAEDWYGDGTAFGSAFHQVMERIDLCRPLAAQIAAEAARAADYWGVPDAKELIELVQKTLEHPLLLRVRSAGRLFKELPFCYRLDSFLVEGVVDLLFQEGEELVIVDYKTDAGGEEELERRWEHYRCQGCVYAAAMAEITGRPVKEVSFIFVRKGLVKSFFNPDPASLRRMLRENINRAK